MKEASEAATHMADFLGRVNRPYLLPFLFKISYPN